MTIRLIDAYFCRVQGTPIPGKIEAFFSPEPPVGTTAKLEPQAEIVDAECRDKVKEVPHFSDDELMLTTEESNELEADVDVSGSDAEDDCDSDDEDLDRDEQGEDYDDKDMDCDDE
jgi:hypothetical protein